MKGTRNMAAMLLLIIFSCYYCSISMFSHTHIVHGVSVIHSHLGGSSEHAHSESQYTIIDILSHFQSEYALSVNSIGVPVDILSEILNLHYTPHTYDCVRAILSLRGPPQI